MEGPIFIVGPTSVGKSGLALEIAALTGGEIVNADAFQIYDALGLLTAKPDAAVCRQVPHHLFGTVPLSDAYNVARYLAEANDCLTAIRRRDRLAIIVGGTGLYIKALTHGLSPLPAPDPGVRARLDTMSLPELHAELAYIDPLAMTQLDLQNKRRVVRALEVSLATGTPFSAHRDAWTHSRYGTGEAGVLLDREREDLRARIDQQIECMFAVGVVDEVRAFAPETVGPTAAATIGLAEIRQLLTGEVSLSECKERIKTRTRQYAKRQVTWFKRETIFRRVVLAGEQTGRAEALALLAALAQDRRSG